MKRIALEIKWRQNEMKCCLFKNSFMSWAAFLQMQIIQYQCSSTTANNKLYKYSTNTNSNTNTNLSFQAFLLNEPGYSDKNTEPYGSDPIVIIDLLGEQFIFSWGKYKYNLCLFRS